MLQTGREYTLLRDEVLEMRKQSDKTENQLQELLETFRTFENRFGHLERRASASRFGTHLLAALVIAAATYWVAAARMHVVQQRLMATAQEASQQKAEALNRAGDLSAQVAQMRAQQTAVETARATAATLVEYLDGKKEEEAIVLLEKLDFAHLDPLTRKLLTTRVESFRSQVAEEAFQWGKELSNRGRKRDSIKAFEKAVNIWPTGPNAPAARLLLATALREARRYEEAVPVYEEIRKYETDQAVLDESFYWEGFCHAQLGHAEEAARILEQVVHAGNRFSTSAKTQLVGLPATAAQREPAN